MNESSRKQAYIMKEPAPKGPSLITLPEHKRFSVNRGFTLLEVMIATLVLAIGLLGIAGLQVTGLQSNTSSLMRTQATLFASDIAERMRVNNGAFSAGDYNLATATVRADCKSTTGCTPAQMAENDVSVWNTKISNALPAGAGIICIDSTPLDGASSVIPACDGNGSVHAIKIWWQDDRTTTPKRFVVTHIQ